MSKTDDQVHAELAVSNQPAIYRFQRKIKDAIDPNDIGDRLYATLPPESPEPAQSPQPPQSPEPLEPPKASEPPEPPGASEST